MLRLLLHILSRSSVVSSLKSVKFFTTNKQYCFQLNDPTDSFDRDFLAFYTPKISVSISTVTVHRIGGLV